jgi:hypothetical protein
MQNAKWRRLVLLELPLAIKATGRVDTAGDLACEVSDHDHASFFFSFFLILNVDVVCVCFCFCFYLVSFIFEKQTHT